MKREGIGTGEEGGLSRPAKRDESRGIEVLEERKTQRREAQKKEYFHNVHGDLRIAHLGGDSREKVGTYFLPILKFTKRLIYLLLRFFQGGVAAVSVSQVKTTETFKSPYCQSSQNFSVVSRWILRLGKNMLQPVRCLKAVQ